MKALLEVREISEFEVATQHAEGKAGFSARLDGLKPIRGFEVVNTLVLVSDSNGNPEESFKEIQRQVKQVEGYGVPVEVLKPSPKQGELPSIAVILLPWADRIGCIESLLWEVLSDAFPDLIPKVNELLKEAPTRDCAEGKHAKARVACMLAAVCVDDPSCSVSHMWYTRRNLRHLLRSNRFDSIVAALQQLLGAPRTSAGTGAS